MIDAWSRLLPVCSRERHRLVRPLRNDGRSPWWPGGPATVVFPVAIPCRERHTVPGRGSPEPAVGQYVHEFTLLTTAWTRFDHPGWAVETEPLATTSARRI